MTVYDRNDLPVSGLKRENFQVYEDRALQTLTGFSQADIQTAVGLVVDTSGSMHERIRLVSQTAKSFLETSNPNDEVFLVEFAQQVSLVEDFTRDFHRIREALDSLATGAQIHFANTPEELQAAAAPSQISFAPSTGFPTFPQTWPEMANGERSR